MKLSDYAIAYINPHTGRPVNVRLHDAHAIDFFVMHHVPAGVHYNIVPISDISDEPLPGIIYDIEHNDQTSKLFYTYLNDL